MDISLLLLASLLKLISEITPTPKSLTMNSIYSLALLIFKHLPKLYLKSYLYSYILVNKQAERQY